MLIRLVLHARPEARQHLGPVLFAHIQIMRSSSRERFVQVLIAAYLPLLREHSRRTPRSWRGSPGQAVGIIGRVFGQGCIGQRVVLVDILILVPVLGGCPGSAWCACESRRGTRSSVVVDNGDLRVGIAREPDGP